MQQRHEFPNSTPVVLFFFELLLFLLSMLTLGLGEFVSRGLALGVWLACTAASLVGYLLAHRSTALDDRWNRTLLYTWRRTNALLLLGAIVVGAWYWLSTGA